MPRPVRLFGGDSRGSRDGAVLAGGITPSLAVRSLSRITYSADVHRSNSCRRVHAEGDRGSPPAKGLVICPRGRPRRHQALAPWPLLALTFWPLRSAPPTYSATKRGLKRNSVAVYPITQRPAHAPTLWVPSDPVWPEQIHVDPMNAARSIQRTQSVLSTERIAKAKGAGSAEAIDAAAAEWDKEVP